MLVLSACSTTNRATHDARPSESKRIEASAAVASLTEADVESRLRTEVSAWAGTPHVLGGTTSRGIDCSAFVQEVFRDAFDVQLPRSTSEQVLAGAAVGRDELLPGDLVFFKPPTKTRHVGIYLDDGEFAHASSSQGVTVSDLGQDYWVRSYWTSRRILAPSDRPILAERPPVPADPPLVDPPADPPRHASADDDATTTPPRGRIGW